VLGRLGVSSLENGQIRVTKISGSGILWGGPSTISDQGWLSVSEGVNPYASASRLRGGGRTRRDQGSIRITHLSPSGPFWATLADVYADGRLEPLAPTPGMPTLPGGVR